MLGTGRCSEIQPLHRVTNAWTDQPVLAEIGINAGGVDGEFRNGFTQKLQAGIG